MTDRKGRELAEDDPARPGAEGDDALDFRRLLETLLAKYGLRVAEARQLQHALQLRLSEGSIINIFSTGSVQLQGKRTHLAREFVEELRAGVAELRHHSWGSFR